MRIGRAALLAELEGVGLAVFNALTAGDALFLVHAGDVVRAEFAFHLYCKIQVSHEDYTRDSHQQNSPSGANRRLVRRNTTPFTLEIGA